jgi:hypothetical protein
MSEVSKPSTAPPRDSEWVIRYRVLGRSAVWDDMTVCEVLTGPQAGEKRVLDTSDFVDKLERARRRSRA